MQFGDVCCDVADGERRHRRLRMSPLRRDDCVAAVAVAGDTERGLRGIRRGRFVAVVRHAEAAGTNRRRRDRERDRNENSGEREQEQKPGSQSLHRCVNQNPK